LEPHLVSGAGQQGAVVAAQCPATDDGDLHRGF
jgi:saccharopine dehydrogenase-like NADP-dependent oxidoreductase